MLHVILNDGGSISVGGCIVQVYARGVTSVTECLLLTAMSYDRYLAICKPLHYSVSMSSTSCCRIAGLCWAVGFLITLIAVFFLSTLCFCGSNYIDHFSCDIDPLVELSCTDTTILETVLLGLAAPETVIETLFILSTYACIVSAILKMSSKTGRQKAFSTCSSHLAVVCAYYATLIAVYVFPSSKTFSSPKKFFSLMYTVVTPLFNPIIYSLKNQEIRTALKKNALSLEYVFYIR
ncbi:olfactory receptor 5V1-like [Gastrophryne carolinensis]